MQKFDITLYFVGETPEQALEGLAFDSAESAQSYAFDTHEGPLSTVKVYSVSAFVDPETIEEVN